MSLEPREGAQFDATLTQSIPQVCCDWCVLGERLVFGELTLFNGAGPNPIDEEHDKKLGCLIDLKLAYGD